MTELQFLIDLLLNHKLPKKTKDAVAERIKTVENGIIPAPKQIQAIPSVAQLNVSARMPPPEPMVAAPMPPIANPALLGKQEIDKETGRPMIATGNGTRGPRKF